MFNQNNECMKRLSLILFSVAIAVSGFFTSCTDDTDTSFDKPTIDVLLGGQAVSGTIEKTEGTALNFEIKFSMGAAEDKLTKIRISSTIGGKTFNVIDSVLDAGLFNGGDKEFVYTYNTSVGTSEEKLSFYTEDSKNRTQEEVITIKPVAIAPVGDFVTRTAILMGGQDNATIGSSYSISLNKVLTLLSAKENSSAVDFMYYYGATNKATLGSPSNTDVQSVFNATKYPNTNVAGWATKNTTNFADVTVANFDNITVTDFDAKIATVGTDKQSTQLAVGEVIAFKTATKSGLIKVEQISTTTSAGYIKISIKMKK